MKKALGAALPFLMMHALCCGTVLVFLVSSGYLLALRQEGSTRTWLFALLGVFFATLALQTWHRHHCAQAALSGKKHDVMRIAFSIVISLMLSLMFMVYVFLPWWIPNYNGGMLLP